jgi:hypothetical protein
MDDRLITIGYDNVQFVSFTTPVPSPATPDGGYISLRSNDVVAQGLSHLDAVKLDFDYGTLNMAADTSQFSISSAALGYEGWDYDATTNFSGTGLHPAIISAPSESNLASSISIGQVIAPAEKSTGRSGGGSIAIPSLLASLQQESLLSNRPSNSRVASARADASLSARGANSASSNVSGELARAAVFELIDSASADSQHIPSELRSTNDASFSSEEKSLSAVDEPPTRFDTKTAANGIHRSEVYSAEPSLPRNQADESIQIPTAIDRQSTNGRPAVQAVSANSGNGTETEPNEIADSNQRDRSAAAFQDLAAAETANLNTPADSNLWSRSRAATPLLLIIALERIAALNSRNSARRPTSALEEKHLGAQPNALATV